MSDLNKTRLEIYKLWERSGKPGRLDVFYKEKMSEILTWIKSQ